MCHCQEGIYGKYLFFFFIKWVCDTLLLKLALLISFLKLTHMICDILKFFFCMQNSVTFLCICRNFVGA